MREQPPRCAREGLVSEEGWELLVQSVELCIVDGPCCSLLGSSIDLMRGEKRLSHSAAFSYVKRRCLASANARIAGEARARWNVTSAGSLQVATLEDTAADEDDDRRYLSRVLRADALRHDVPGAVDGLLVSNLMEHEVGSSEFYVQ